MSHRKIDLSEMPADAKLVIDHSSRQRPYFDSNPKHPEDDYVCVFTIESCEQNLGFMYINHFPSAVHRMKITDQKKWLFEHLTSASFIKSHPLK